VTLISWFYVCTPKQRKALKRAKKSTQKDKKNRCNATKLWTDASRVVCTQPAGRHTSHNTFLQALQCPSKSNVLAAHIRGAWQEKKSIAGARKKQLSTEWRTRGRKFQINTFRSEKSQYSETKKTPADSFDKSVNSFFIRARIKTQI